MIQMKHLTALIVAASLGGCAATYESAQENYNKGEYTQAREEWTELAIKGDSQSMYSLYTSTNSPADSDIKWLKKAADTGLAVARYDYGILMVKQGKYKEGIDYITLASEENQKMANNYLSENKTLIPLWLKAENNNASAMVDLGKYYKSKKEYIKSVLWFEKGAELKNAIAQFYLGVAYDFGYGKAKNQEKAFEWYQKSALQGSESSAQYNLAFMYANGQGVTVDQEKAFYWYQKASQQGDLEGTAELGRRYLYGIGTKKEMAKAFQLLSSTADKNKYAAYHLGRIYYNGWGVSKDYELSYKWFHNAAKKGNTSAQWYVGQHYYLGLGKTKNFSEAFKWFEPAAKNGDRDAQFRLGWMYSNAEGVHKDMYQAFNWYQKAAEQGHFLAQNNLAVMYANGEGTVKNNSLAVKWYTKAAKQGDDTAQSNLASRYQYGTGVTLSYPSAVYWYAKAAQQNNKDAQSDLDKILFKLDTKKTAMQETVIYVNANFDSNNIVKTLKREEVVYVLSEGLKWTEVYYPMQNTLGYIYSSHLM